MPVDRGDRDRIIERAHDGRGRESIWEIPGARISGRSDRGNNQTLTGRWRSEAYCSDRPWTPRGRATATRPWAASQPVAHDAGERRCRRGMEMSRIVAFSAALVLVSAVGFGQKKVERPSAATSASSAPATIRAVPEPLAKAIATEVESMVCVDRKRIYSVGMSNGGYLSHRVACEESQWIAAIGPV
ncbi:hypothetical protein LCGC14_1434430, partial [marine sediment metagenome]